MDTPRTDSYFKDILDHLLEGCQIIGFDWRYLYVNEAVARHGCKGRSELLGRRMMDVYPGIDHTPMFRLLAQCMETRQPARMLNEFTYADGSTGWFDLGVTKFG
jgi:PAS domain-containing protein